MTKGTKISAPAPAEDLVERVANAIREAMVTVVDPESDYGAIAPPMDLCLLAAEAALSALEAKGLVIEQGWQPIETAPKGGLDSGEILARSEGNYDSAIVWWGSCETLGLTDAEAEQIDEETFWFESWWTCVVGGAVRLEDDVAPTHWRPLPNPPAASARKGGG